MKNLYDKEYLQDIGFNNLIDEWNEFCSENSWYDDRVYENNEWGLEEAFGVAGSETLLEIARAISRGSYNYQDTHFILRSGNVVSFSWTNELLDFIDEDELLDYMNERDAE